MASALPSADPCCTPCDNTTANYTVSDVAGLPEIATVSLFSTYAPGTTNTVAVRETDRGGVFVLRTTSSVNNGTEFASTVAGKSWFRQFSGYLNVKWFGAKGDGSTDDITAILAAIATLTTGGTVFFPRGTYRFSSAIAITLNNIYLRGEGWGNTILETVTVAHDGIRFQDVVGGGVYGIKVKDVTHAGAAEKHAFESAGSEDIIFDSCYAENSDDAGFRIGWDNVDTSNVSKRCSVINCWSVGTKEGSGIELIRAEDTTVIGNVIENSAEHGIRITGAPYTRAIGNHLRNNGTTAGHGIYLGGGDKWTSNAVVANNYIYHKAGAGYAGIFAHPPNVDGNRHDNVVANNVIEGDGATALAYGMILSDPGATGNRIIGYNIVGNTFNNVERGVYMTARVEDITIANNRVNNPYGTGILLQTPTSANRIFVRDNEISGSVANTSGIILGVDSGSDATLARNTVTLTSPLNNYFFSGAGQIFGDVNASTSDNRQPGFKSFYVDAAQLIPRTTSGPARAQRESATNKVNYDVLLFDDTTEEYAQFKFMAPENLDFSKGIKAVIHWTSPAASGTTVFGMRAHAVSNGGAIDAALGAEISVPDAVEAAGAVQATTTAVTAMTIAGSSSARAIIWIQIYRKPGHASDNLVGDCEVLGVTFEYRISPLYRIKW